MEEERREEEGEPWSFFKFSEFKKKKNYPVFIAKKNYLIHPAQPSLSLQRRHLSPKAPVSIEKRKRRNLIFLRKKTKINPVFIANEIW
jgi:hypothetical protein